jgi:hypothetical protein
VVICCSHSRRSSRLGDALALHLARRPAGYTARGWVRQNQVQPEAQRHYSLLRARAWLRAAFLGHHKSEVVSRELSAVSSHLSDNRESLALPVLPTANWKLETRARRARLTALC